MNDPTEAIRSKMLHEINANVTQENGREYLEKKYGQVWDTSQLTEDFIVEGFLAPLVCVRRKSDGQVGSLQFTHNPRFYFTFEAYNKD